MDTGEKLHGDSFWESSSNFGLVCFMSIEMMADSLLHSPIVPTSFMKDLLVYHLAVTCVHHVQTETQQNLTNNTNVCCNFCSSISNLLSSKCSHVHEPYYLCCIVNSSNRSTLLRRGELLIWGGWYHCGCLSIVIGTTKFITNPPICMRKETALTIKYT